MVVTPSLHRPCYEQAEKNTLPPRPGYWHVYQPNYQQEFSKFRVKQIQHKFRVKIQGQALPSAAKKGIKCKA